MSLFNRLQPRSAKSAPRPRTRLGVQTLEARDVPSWLGQLSSADGNVHLDDFQGVVVDGAGNTYLAGSFTGTIDFDPSDGVTKLTASDTNNAFVARVDPLGGLDWVRQLGFRVSLGSITTHVALDASDTPYLCGAYEGAFGNGYSFTSVGLRDPFLMKLDPGDGATEWATVARGSEGNAAWANDAAVGADGSVYVTGRFKAQADFDPWSSYPDDRDLLTAAGTTKKGNSNDDTFVWKVGPEGQFSSAWKIGGTATEWGESIHVEVDATGAGSLYVQGTFQGTTDLDPRPDVTLPRTSNGSNDVFFARYALTGPTPTSGPTLTWEWDATVGGPSGEFFYQMSADDQCLYLTGEFSGTADFDPGAGNTQTTALGGNDGIVAKYRKSDGGLVWVQAIGGPGTENLNGRVVPDPVSGALYLGGRFEGVADFDRTPADHGGRDVLASRGDLEGFVLKLDAGGKFQKVWRMGGTGVDTARVAAVLHTPAGPQVRVGGILSSPSADYPTGGQLGNPEGDRDAFLMAFDENVAPTTPPVAYVVGGSAAEGNSGPTAITFTVYLSWASAVEVTVNYQTADGTATAGSDYQAAGGPLTFAPGETVKTVAISVTGDTSNEADETFFLNLYDLNWLELGSALGTIRNDDSRGGKK